MANLFNGTFETGDTSQFTSASGSVQSSVVYGGTYAGQNTDNTNFRKILSSAYSTIYIHGMFRYSVDPATSSNWFVLLGDGENSSQFAIRTTAGKLFIEIAGNSTTYWGLTPMVQDTWYSIEIKYVLHDTTGSFEVRLNGVTEIMAVLIDTKAGTDTGIKTIKWQGINAAGNCYVDNLSANDSTWEYSKITMRVSLPGYDCLTDGSIDHYSVFADSDNILIKEYTRGTIGVGYFKYGTITHNLGYIPYTLIFAKSGTKFCNLTGGDMNSSFTASFTAGTGNIIIDNQMSGTPTFYYYIFYDNARSL